MKKLTLSQFWERLEGQEWLYAWVEDPDEYLEAFNEAKALTHLSRLSNAHAQLYSSYWYYSYGGLKLAEDDSVLNLHRPISQKPEAA